MMKFNLTQKAAPSAVFFNIVSSPPTTFVVDDWSGHLLGAFFDAQQHLAHHHEVAGIK